MANKGPNKTMRRNILLSLVLFSSICSFAQDALGYFNFSRKTDEGFVKFVGTPSKYLSFEECIDLSSPFLAMSMNYISIQSENNSVKEKYTIYFVIPFYTDTYIPKGGRLLLKHKNGETLTLVTEKEYESEYSNGNYFVSPEYTITKDNINSIKQKGVVKLRFETLLKNTDIVIKRDDFMTLFNDCISGIEERKNSNQDSFDSDF